jgi:hypothetical protein
VLFRSRFCPDAYDFFIGFNIVLFEKSEVMMTKEIRQIAIYGKGGIGKSAATQNPTAGIAESGKLILKKRHLV